MKKIASIFLSYSWENQKEAEKIYSDLTQIGILVKKDSHELKYKDNIRSFMQSIRDSDFAILLLSDSYLKSVNCMNEAGHLLKEKDVQSKILPIILDCTEIYKAQDRLVYIKYWQQYSDHIKQELKGINPIYSIEVYSDLKLIEEITQMIDGFIAMITSMLLLKYSDLQTTNYKALLLAIGYHNITFLTDLLAIHEGKNDNTKALLFEKYTTDYPPNEHYYLLRGHYFYKLKKFDLAKFNYLQSIELGPGNYEALNNLGMIYQFVDGDFENAKQCFYKAIRANSEFTIARLNLAVLMSQHFKDFDGAKRQYEKILNYNPNEPKAHNNLANYYKSHQFGIQGFEKAQYHLKRAMELDPKYVEPIINYGNLLKLQGRIEEGNKFYKSALKLDKKGEYANVINTLLSSVKG